MRVNVEQDKIQNYTHNSQSGKQRAEYKAFFYNNGSSDAKKQQRNYEQI